MVRALDFQMEQSMFKPCYGNCDKLQPDGLLGSYADFTFYHLARIRRGSRIPWPLGLIAYLRQRLG